MAEWIITSSLLIGVVAVLRWALRGRLSPGAQYALWGLVLLRLLIPFSLGGSGLSVMNAVETAKEQPAAAVFAAVTNYTVPAQSYGEAYAEVVSEYAARGVDVAALEGSELEALDYEAYALMGGKTLGEYISIALLWVWCSGMAAFALWFLLSNLCFYRKLRRGRVPLKTDCPLPVYLSPGLVSPCLFGLFRPAVYVTEAAAEGDALRHVLAHETAHRRHGDVLWSLLRCLCLVLHWYNPLVWLACCLSRRDAEAFADAGAIKKLGEGQRMDYGDTLIALVARKTRPGDLLCTATTMTGGNRGIKERVRLIAKAPKTAAYTAALVLLIAAVAVGCTFTGAKGAEPEPAPPIDTISPAASPTDIVLPSPSPVPSAEWSQADWER